MIYVSCEENGNTHEDLSLLIVRASRTTNAIQWKLMRCDEMSKSLIYIEMQHTHFALYTLPLYGSHN